MPTDKPQSTYIILDGLYDADQGVCLSQNWARAGLRNKLDVTGQAAELWRPDGQAITESDMDLAANLAMAFGLVIHDRVGQAFVADNDLDALRSQITYEYRCRLATALMFGLPALGLHYFAQTLAGASGLMIFPWLFEMGLVGWVCLAAGWPMLWQGGQAMIHLRMTMDLFFGLVILLAFVPSAYGTLSGLWLNEPWFGDSPYFYVANLAMMLACLQRYLIFKNVHRLQGKAHLLIKHFSTLLNIWLVAGVTILFTVNMEMGLALLMVWPMVLGLGAVNRWSPGVMIVLPVIGFALVLLMGPTLLGRSITGLAVEVACCFVLMMTGVIARGWHADVGQR